MAIVLHLLDSFSGRIRFLSFALSNILIQGDRINVFNISDATKDRFQVGWAALFCSRKYYRQYY
jgi:hypothetical protein